MIGALPSITDILLQDSFTSGANLSNKERFVTLVDTVIMPGGSTTVSEQFRKMDLPAVYSGTTAAIGSIATGGLYFVACAATVNAAPNLFNFFSRIRYTDC